MCHSTPTLSSHYTVGQYGGRPVTFNNLLTPQFVMNEGRDKLTRSPQMWVVTAGSPTVPASCGSPGLRTTLKRKFRGNNYVSMWRNDSEKYFRTLLFYHDISCSWLPFKGGDKSILINFGSKKWNKNPSTAQTRSFSSEGKTCAETLQVVMALFHSSASVQEEYEGCANIKMLPIKFNCL